jgi:class 3 adenylate cyclase
MYHQGDCYIAVAGVPDPREDHAVVMALFADECRRQAQHTFHELSIKLDPSVTELSMRFGLHSGSITAGVLRGEKSRFELFGDTINTASRMESTCKPGKIQISEETAGYLCRVGLDSWLQPRMDIVHVKGKGFVKTYWLEIGTSVKFESDNKHQQVNIATASEDRQMSFVHELYPPSDI